MSRSSGIDPKIELSDSQGRSVTNITAFADAVLDVPLASGGTYYFLLSDLNGDETGTYGVSLERLNNPANAKPIAYGQTLQAYIDAVDEITAYSFQAHVGAVVRVRMSRSSGIDPQIELFDSQGLSLTNITPFATVFPYTTLFRSGTYYFLLSDLNGDETGTYGVSLERLNNPANAKPIAYGQTLQAYIDAVDEITAYSFQAHVGAVVRVRMSRSSGIDPQIELFDSQGLSLTNITPFATVFPYTTLFRSGTYYFLLSDLNGDETGTYGVSLERLNNPANAKPIAYGQTLQASIDAVAEMDAYSFQAQAGDMVRVRMRRSSGIDPKIELFDAQGRSVTNITAFADAVLDVPLASSGTYYFLLSDLNGDETGTYGVSPTRRSSDLNAKPIAYGQTLQASIDAVAKADAYSFQAQAGDVVRVRMSRSSGIDPKIELFDSQGRSVTNITAFADAVLDVPLASGGTYYFLLSDLNGDETGAYGVSLLCPYTTLFRSPIAYGQTLQASIDAVAKADAYSFQ